MKTLVLVFHPNLKASRINARLLAELAKTGDADVTVRDEYALYPDFQVDAKAEQAALEAADRIVIQFPFYWYSSPALLKQWEDAVIQSGWAYGGGRALKGKQVRLVVTTGSPTERYQEDGEYHHTMRELLSPFELTAFRIELDWAEPFLVQGCATMDDEGLSKAAEAYVEAVTR